MPKSNIIYFNPLEEQKHRHKTCLSISDISSDVLKYQKDHNFTNKILLEDIVKQKDSKITAPEAEEFFSGTSDIQEQYFLGSLLYYYSSIAKKDEIKEFMIDLVGNLAQIGSKSKNNDEIKEYLSILNSIYQDPETGDLRNNEVSEKDKNEILKRTIEKSAEYSHDTGRVLTYIENRLAAERNFAFDPENQKEESIGFLEKESLEEISSRLKKYQKKNNLEEFLGNSVEDVLFAYNHGIKEITLKKKTKNQYKKEFCDSIFKCLENIPNIETVNEATKLMINLIIFSEKDETSYEKLNSALRKIGQNLESLGISSDKKEEADNLTIDDFIVETLGSKLAKKQGIVLPTEKEKSNYSKEDLDYNLEYFKMLNNVLKSEEYHEIFPEDRLAIVYKAIDKTELYANNLDKIQTYVKNCLNAEKSI